jgi:hypothetical protein
MVDGLNAAVISSFDSCSYKESPSEETMACPHIFNYDCTCVYKSSSDDGVPCHYFSGPAIGNNHCHYIETVWLQNLNAATAFDVFSLLFIFALSVTSCVSLCCSSSAVVPTDVYMPPTRVTAAPAVVIYTSSANGEGQLADGNARGAEVQLTNYAYETGDAVRYLSPDDVSLTGVPVAQALYVPKP